MTDGTEKTGTEIIAREIAFWHGAKVLYYKNGAHTVASVAGYGHAPEKYADARWREYIQAAEAMLERINKIDGSSEPPSPST